MPQDIMEKVKEIEGLKEATGYTHEELLRKIKEVGTHCIHLSVGAVPLMNVNGNLVPAEWIGVVTQTAMDYLLADVLTEEEQKILMEEGDMVGVKSIAGLGRYRVNFFRQRGSLSATVHVMEPTVADPSSLFIPNAILDLAKREKGLIIVCGGAGSGRSTTIASILEQINMHRRCSIMTIEDPIEYLFKHKKSIVNQRELSVDSKSLSHALKYIFEEAPDVVMITKISTKKDIQSVLELVESGKLVITSMNTRGLYDTICRLIKVFPEEERDQAKSQVARCLNTVVTQQLLPSSQKDVAVVPAFELMHINSVVRKQIKDGNFKDIEDQVIEHSRSSFTMDRHIHTLLMRNMIDSKTALRYANNISVMEVSVKKLEEQKAKVAAGFPQKNENGEEIESELTPGAEAIGLIDDED